jgi:hypothetical protein
MSGHVPSARPARPRDFEGIFTALLDAHPRDTLQLLCGATLRDGAVITVESMDNILEQTETGREIARINREEGREEGHVDLMRAALRAAYGDIIDLDELARRLADGDHSGNIARIVAGATLDDLRA